ncbi:E3 ubiquitin-protein ligase MARCHF5-like, partial [Etheostoma cragini]|uniref:E3 ubiquitin-protein ligase MARCHF5-like n=1 Tax=Etheostoma cragini TaxID=417921 RepID=UPI00155E6987
TVCPLSGARRYVPRVPADGFGAGDHLSVSRTLCGALVFPSIASLVGRLLFRRMSSSLQRTVLGGVAFVLIKGVLKVYFKQQQVIMQTSRIILNYPERNRDGQNEGGEEDTEDTEDSGNE